MTATAETVDRHSGLGKLAPNVTYHPPADETPHQRAERMGSLRAVSAEKGFAFAADGWAYRKAS
ncbi:hypothetical protein LG293_16675 (plasmid) [Citricoccus nitrophenolicus]